MKDRIEDMKARFDEAIYQTENLFRIFKEIQEYKKGLSESELNEIRNYPEFQEAIVKLDKFFKVKITEK